MGKYVLRCLECGRRIKDEFTNRCPHHDSLLVSEYETKKFCVKNLPGMWKFIDWLPAENPIDIDTAPITYKSEGFGKELGLPELYISFSGYWPEREARIRTCSFKELEAAATFPRLTERSKKIPVIPSAGNTGRAFAHISYLTGSPVVVLVPKQYVFRMWSVVEPTPTCLLISVEGDYTDTIKLGERIASLEGMVFEGGVRNVARRDGMGTLLLDSILTIGRLPDHYFQAVGSGVGAIAVFEASKRVLNDGRFGKKLPRLHLSQNIPFAPMFRAWRAGRKEIVPDVDLPNAGDAIENMYASVLSNRNPPYSLRGGVYDVLHETGGEMYGITNEEAVNAEKLFEGVEGIDLDPAASVCVASLLQAVEMGKVGKDEKVLLNISGGGYDRVKEDLAIIEIEPDLRMRWDTPIEEIESSLREWWRDVRRE